MQISLDRPLSLSDLKAVYEGKVALRVARSVSERAKKGAQAIEAVLSTQAVVYGVNTGFGLLSSTVIPREDLEALQRNLVLSHACGVGPLLPDEIVRLVLVLKLASLSQGASGVRPETIDAIARLVQNEIYPCIPAKGSVGASGDLA